MGARDGESRALWGTHSKVFAVVRVVGIGGGAFEGGVEAEEHEAAVDGVVAAAGGVGGNVVAVPGFADAKAQHEQAEEDFAHGVAAGDHVAGVFHFLGGWAQVGDDGPGFFDGFDVHAAAEGIVLGGFGIGGFDADGGGLAGDFPDAVDGESHNHLGKRDRFKASRAHAYVYSS